MSRDPSMKKKKKTEKQKKVRKTRAERKRERLEAKNAVLPIHKRPIICPPDKAGRHPAFRLLGYICRALIIWLSAAGLTTFISDALQFGTSHGFILLSTLLFVALLALACCGKLQAAAAGVVAAGLAAWRLATVPHLVTDLYWGLLSLYNAALERLYRVGYLSYVKFEADIHSPTDPARLLVIGTALLGLILSVVFTLCLIRRVRLIPPAVLSTTILVVLLTFNIYSNRIESNLGIMLVIISFAALLVMSAFDSMYRVKDAKKYDTEFSLFGDSDRPSMPEAYVAELAAKKAARDQKKAARRKAVPVLREEPVTVEEELTDYFAVKPQKAKKAKSPADPAARAAAKAARKQMMKEVRAVRAYDRVTEQAKRAMGGFAAAAALVVFLAVIALPAIFIKGNFTTIQSIDEKMAYARDYVTAVLRGDDAALDELEYKADGSNFMSHSTALEQLEFTGKQMFYVMSRYNTNYYMTGWIGTDYDAEAGAWNAVNDEQLTAYRTLFKTADSPAETMRYNFYHYMRPSVVDDTEYTDNLLTKYQANLDYGFVNVLFHARRVNSPSSSLFLPSVFGSRMGLYDYETTDPSSLTFVNYFDGIRTGRKFKESKVSYAAMTYAPVMTNKRWTQNVGRLASSYSLTKEALLAQRYLNVDPATGAVSSNLTLTTYSESDALTMLLFSYRRGGEEINWRFYHASSQVKKSNGSVTITTDEGSLVFSTDGGRVVGVKLTGCETENGRNLLDSYENTMTDEERTALSDSILLDFNYSNFAYDTYTNKAGSAVITEMAKRILQQAHTEVEVETTEIIEDDPETEEDESDVIIHVEYQRRPADVSLAAIRNAGGADAFVQRDLLVRNVIDYIITDLGCKYTLTPDTSDVDPTLDGVENFLVHTHEGYCVQFASAAALILREYGIPVRFVEGYVATNLTKLRGDFVYGGYVHDYEAHAWIEVWFDGLGWIQYETTPQYYTGMYGTKGTGGTIHVDPVFPDDETKEPVETLPDDPVIGPEDETETETEVETEDPAAAATLRGAGITFAVLVGLAALIVLIATVVNKARDAEANRQRIAMTILDESYGEHTNESDRRETSLEMLNAVTDLLAIYGLSPKPGEFRDEYADRLTLELTSEDENAKTPRRRGAPALPDMHRVMDAMAAEEFGHGMTVQEMKLLAALYFVLRSDLKHYVPLSERIRLRYFKRKL